MTRTPAITAVKAGMVVAAVLAGVRAASAQEYCVSCADPAAVYRCIIDDARAASGMPLQMLCVSQLAERGKHATCAVKRVTVLECDGQIVHVAMPRTSGPAAPVAAAPAPPPSAPKTPDTLVGVVEEAGKASKESLKSAGQAIGDGAKKTWNCMKSLFSKC